MTIHNPVDASPHPSTEGKLQRERSVLALACMSALLLMGAQPAMAQSGTNQNDRNLPKAESATELDKVVVTASRVIRGGFSAPTPTTTITMEEINASGSTNVAEIINQMPSVRPSLTPSSTVNNSRFSGGYYLDLRGLGFNRTLVLVDGKRAVPTQVEGPVDINSIPQALIRSVDIVTGGASAAWGSDAVAGVVNFVLDHQLEGFKGVVQGGKSDHGDRNNYLTSVAFGTSFADDRGRLLFGAEAAGNDGIENLSDRSWGAKGWGLIANPDYTAGNDEPRRLLRNNIHSSAMSYGGLINKGPLAGTQFDRNGEPVPFEYGDMVNASTMIGGDGSMSAENLALEVPLDRHSVYTRVSYDLTASTTGFAEASWAQSETSYGGLTRTDSKLTIYRDNPFLPAAVAADMDNLDLGSFQMGRYNRDYGRSRINKQSDTGRFSVGLEGYAGDNWSWDAYYSHGESETEQITSNNRIISRFDSAVDATTDAVTGAAVCRDAEARADGCVALNLFGEGAPSPEALAYMMGTARTRSRITQEVAAATLRGDLFSMPSGPVSVATGLEWRQEEAAVTSDPLSTAGSFATGNAVPWQGSVDVTEVFGEAVIPLAKDTPWARSLDLDLAARATRYSTSGTARTWKVGSSWQINDVVKLRGTRSRDIRAPSLSELFSGGTTASFNVFDPILDLSYSVGSVSSGNTGLKPEEADTITAGFVLNPAQNFMVSVDYYRIKVDDAIITFQASELVDRCYTIQPQVCELIVRGEDGRIDHVNVAPQNLQSMEVAGVDLEAVYRTTLAAGDLSLRSLISYVDTIKLDDGDGVTELVGSSVQPTIASVGGQPHWSGNLSATYRLGAISLNAGARHVGGARINNAYTSKDLDVLEHSSRTYFDLGGSYDLHSGGDSDMTVFLSIRNLMDKDPPINGSGYGTARSLYDVAGRTYTVGLRFNF